MSAPGGLHKDRRGGGMRVFLGRRAVAVGALELVAVGAAALPPVAGSLLALPNPHGILGAIFAVVMMAVAAIDARRFVIPDALSLAVLALGVVNAVLDAGIAAPLPLESGAIAGGVAVALLRGAVLAALFLGLQIAYRHFRGREGLGLGDVKLAGAGGVWLDWPTMPLVIEIAAVAALVFYLLRYAVRRNSHGLRLTSRLPFGLFLAPAIWLGWFLQTLASPWTLY